MATLTVWNVVANVVDPDGFEIPLSLVAVALLIAIARRAGVARAELGLAEGEFGSGAKVGSVAVALVAAAVVLLLLIPAVRDALADGRFEGVGTGEMLYNTLLRIPIATALAEEVAFRGVVLGMLLAWMAPLRAVIVSSALFGLWHILPGIAALDTTATLDTSGAATTVAAVGAQVLITAVAGLALCWLRFRGRHLAAPMLAHWAVNAGLYVAGWLVVRHGWS